MLSAGEAAEYVGLPVKRLKMDCPVLPVAMPGGRTLYDLRDLDTWLDTLKDSAADCDDAILERLG